MYDVLMHNKDNICRVSGATRGAPIWTSPWTPHILTLIPLQKLSYRFANYENVIIRF